MLGSTTIHPTSSDRQHLIDLFLFKGRPVNSDPDHSVVVLVNQGYVVGFSPDRLQPAWAAYRVAGSARDVDYDRPHLYYDDCRLDPELRITPNTFGTHGGIAYHVGHMVPNEVINRQFGRLAQMETFFMSNMCPQRGSLNTGVWLDLENRIRNIEDTSQRDHVWAIAGPVFKDNPETIPRPGGQGVPIPSSFYYITIDPFRYPWDRPGNVDVACFVIPQDAERNTPLDAFVTDLDVVEAATNLSFFPEWPAAPSGFAAASPSLGSRETRHRLLRQLC
jgi:endonuclease G, mitochondrial